MVKAKKIYKDLKKNRPSRYKNYDKIRLFTLFKDYHKYLLNLLKRFLVPIIDKTQKFENKYPKQLVDNFKNIHKSYNLENIDLLKSKIRNFNFNSVISIEAESPFYDCEKFEWLVHVISDARIEKNKFENIDIELNFIEFETIEKSKFSFPYSHDNFKELELYLLKEIQNLPEGLDSFILILVFLNNLISVESEEVHKLYFTILYIIRRFLHKDSHINMLNELEYYKFLGLILKAGASHIKTYDDISHPTLYPIFYKLRNRLQKGEDVTDKLICILGIIFPYSVINNYRAFFDRQFEFIEEEDFFVCPLISFYKASIFDTYALLTKNGFLKLFSN